MKKVLRSLYVLVIMLVSAFIFHGSAYMLIRYVCATSEPEERETWEQTETMGQEERLEQLKAEELCEAPQPEVSEEDETSEENSVYYEGSECFEGWALETSLMPQIR